jgi:hypothetical protein
MLQDEHRYDPPRSRRELAWLRQERPFTLDGPHRGKPGWFWRLLRAIGRLVGAQ